MTTLGEAQNRIHNILRENNRGIECMWDVIQGNMKLECIRIFGEQKVLDVIAQYICRPGEKISLNSEIHGVLTYMNDMTHTYDELRDKINQVV